MTRKGSIQNKLLFIFALVFIISISAVTVFNNYILLSKFL